MPQGDKKKSRSAVGCRDLHMKLHWFGLQLLGLAGKFVDHQIGFEVGGAEWLQRVVYHQKAIVLLGEVVE